MRHSAKHLRPGWLLAAIATLALGHTGATAGGPERGSRLDVTLRSRVEDRGHPGRFALVERVESWVPAETAVIVCDMWDFHHCLNAVRRGSEMAPTMDRVLKEMRGRGVTIIHAPSDCMDAYKGHAARRRALETPRSANIPAGIGSWCDRIPAEERGRYPIDQSDGGEDDDPAEHSAWAAKLAGMGRNPKAPWKSQTDLLTIDEAADFISADGEEIWSILEARGIRNVVLMGVHLNMCVLGRPFGLRQLSKNGKNVALMRDLTDTMYNPARAPFVGHFAGTDLMVEHVEKYVCPTVSSEQVLGGAPFRYASDARPRIAFLIDEDEYQTHVSLPAFAAAHLTKDYRVSYLLGSPADPDRLSAIGELDGADLLFVSARRRVLPESQVEALRRFVASGKPVIGIRTASHAFAPRAGKAVPEGRRAWASFDADVLGGNYHNHHDASPAVEVRAVPGAEAHPILAGVDSARIKGHGSLYKVRPLGPSATGLLIGSIPGQEPEPVAWTNAPATGNRVFYTSLGQIDDFASDDFNRLLADAIGWALGRGGPSSGARP
ncbi:Trehalose utilization [Aquisphaera giovannonii]|uniref:Trehalose utilization n=1 Tax=Aquisphaera giovannonii TaxID=406548 RepID=A0A5B9VZJ4_9BACT|nr:ThuA domain-containing protein [Aquisphaera giovannonii]QEH33772.1 Trehalose utilization [Aquisphaera giovannonii]